MSISVCMASYNGGLFIRQQLDSILSQLGVEDEVVVVDDCSTDNTHEILSEFDDKRLTVVRNIENLGVLKSFSKALSVAKGDYLFLSDQDDVWLPDKVEKSLYEMKRMEGEYGKDKPLLVHTDLKLVDSDLKPIANSFWEQKKFNIEKCQDFPRLLMQNVVTGCTCMINRPLKELALPVPENVIMHDWWFALVAVSQGHVSAIMEQTILYRQHDRNVLGSKTWLKYVVSRIAENFKSDYIRDSIKRVILQATVFRDKYYDDLDEHCKKPLDILCGLMEYGFLARRYYVIKYQFLKAGFVRNLGLLLFL